MVNLNVMVFLSSSCNAETQNNAERLLKKRAATHIQRKNCENRNTEKKPKLPELMGGWGYYLLGIQRLNNLSNANNNKVETDWDQGYEM